MKLHCQQSCIELLEQYAQNDKHSILIEGGAGCGKSYCVQVLAQLLSIDDIVTVRPTVSEVRGAVDACYTTEQRLLVCIDNLDSGVVGASYALLKFLEEPKQNVYVVITCTNSCNVPSTILSRSVVATIGYPTCDDIVQYATTKDSARFEAVRAHPIWGGVYNFNDIDYVCGASSAVCEYFAKLQSDIKSNRLSKDSVSNIAWRLGHYPDNSEADVAFVLQFILHQNLRGYVYNACLQCLSDFRQARMASHVVLAKFAMEFKYGA